MATFSNESPILSEPSFSRRRYTRKNGMKKIATTIFLLFLSPLLAIADDNALKSEVNSKVTQLTSMIGDPYSQEYTSARGIQIMIRDNKDNLAVAVAVFTIESFGLGNNYTQFMAVFANLSKESEGHPQKLSLLDFMAVGGKGIRSLDFKNIRLKQSQRDIIIAVPTSEYGPEDAMCCPSIKSEAQFIIRPRVGGRLLEISSNPYK